MLRFLLGPLYLKYVLRPYKWIIRRFWIVYGCLTKGYEVWDVWEFKWNKTLWLLIRLFNLKIEFKTFIQTVCLSAERLWLPPGPVCGGCDAWSVFNYGTTVVRGCHRPLHLAREQLEAGVWVLSTWRAAQVPGNQRATLHRPHDLRAHGLLCLYDFCPKGQ